MRIEQTIINAVSLSKATKIPVLFFSNPGLGKTTILKRYANKNGMHLETLIGSRFSPEEISGYQVNNGGDHLQHLNPEWFNRIKEKAETGITTLLFIDELSTCSEAVQGPLLSLIFDRTIGSEKYLPEDCIVVSAANYSGNLSSYMNIISPALNRFCVINLNDNYSSMDMLDEFLDMTEVVYPEKTLPLSQDEECFFNEKYKKFWKDTFSKYADTESPNGYLDISNQNLGAIYTESEKFIFNFISGRSIFYLRHFIKAYLEYGIKDKEFLEKIIDGFVGNGTCNFLEEEQKDNYREFVHKGLDRIVNQRERKTVSQKLTGNISKDIAEFIVNKDNLNTNAEDDLNVAVQLTKEIVEHYQLENIIKNTKTPEQVAAFITDFESLIELQQQISHYPDAHAVTYQITKVAMDFYGYYCDMLGTTPDFGGTFGVSNNLFERVCFLRYSYEPGNTKTVRVAKRQGEKNCYPFFIPLENDISLLEAQLTKPLSNSDSFQVLIYENGFKYRHIDNYLKKNCKAA